LSAAKRTLVIRNGTLIDGSGKPSNRNDAIVVEDNRIKSVGALPGDVVDEAHLRENLASLTRYIGRRPAAHAVERS
jgi:N-acyl-D-aspartate/D-glutamate deacylase